MIRALVAWGPAAIWAAVLFFLSDLQNVPLAARFPLGDQFAHFVLFGVLGAALGWGKRKTPPAPHVLLLALGWSYGAVDEWHQSLVPGRMPELADFFADLAGVTVGYLLVLVLLGWRGGRAGEAEGPASSGRGGRGSRPSRGPAEAGSEGS